LYDALDFSTDRNDDGCQTRESLSRIAAPSAAVAELIRRVSRIRFDARGKSFELLTQSTKPAKKKSQTGVRFGEVQAALACTGGNNRPEIRTDQPLPEATAGQAKGVMRGNGPPISQFKDPAGNILSVFERTM